MTLIWLATRDDLVGHLTADHGIDPVVAGALSEMGARIAHASAHAESRVTVPHAHAG